MNGDFQMITRSHTRKIGFHDLNGLQKTIAGILKKTEAGLISVRLQGGSMSAFTAGKDKVREFQPEFKFPE